MQPLGQSSLCPLIQVVYHEVGRSIRVMITKDRVVSPAKCIQNAYHDTIVLAFSPENLARSMWKFVLVAIR